MSETQVSEEDLRQRLLGNGKTEEEIEAIINQYHGALQLRLPTAEHIAKLAKKNEQSKAVSGRFSLTPEEHALLMDYFGDQDTPTVLVQKALAEFLKLMR